MHEMSIACSVLDALEQESSHFPRGRILRVGLRLGELAGVDACSLEFCWEAVVRGTRWETVALEIERCPRRQRCQSCGHEFSPAGVYACPACGSASTVFAGGDELELAHLEVEQDEPDWARTQSSE